MRKLKLFILILIDLIGIAIFFFLNRSKIGSLEILKARYKNFAKLNKYAENHAYLINNNLAQYSSYIMIEKDELNKTTSKIESFVMLNYKYIKYFGGKENFTCVIKLISTDEIIELEASDSQNLSNNASKKLIFNIKMDTIDLNDLVVAVIWKFDFSKEMHIKNMTQLKQPFMLPFSLIKFQVPTVVASFEPRLPSISFCVHYTYYMPPQIINWFDYHLSFGVREIMIYDGTNNSKVTQVLRSKYGLDDRVTVRPYITTLSDLCNETILFKQYTESSCPVILKNFLLKSCVEFYNGYFKEKYRRRGNHEKITVNDCYGILSRKHEFIGYYDLDEFVFPRSFSALKLYEDSTFYKCDSFDSICKINPLKNNFTPAREDNPNGNFLYNYINSLIETVRNGRDRNKLGSIAFPHAAVINPDFTEKRLIEDLGLIINDINKPNSNLSFPRNLFLRSPLTDVGHIFIIQREDVEYIKYLYKSYTNLIPCIYQNYLKTIDNVNKNLIRYLYFMTEGKERFGKRIHFYKYVKTIWVHTPQTVDTGHWDCTSKEPLNGYFVAHYRADIGKTYRLNATGSIRKLNIDFEYVFFLLKNYTKFCEFQFF